MFGVPCLLCWPYSDELTGKHPADWLFNFEVGRLQELMAHRDNMTQAEEKDLKLVQSAEAIYHIQEVSKGKTTPIFTAHGTRDTLVTPAKAQWLNNALAKAGVPHKTVMVNNGRHMYGGWKDEPIEQAISFVQKYI